MLVSIELTIIVIINSYRYWQNWKSFRTTKRCVRTSRRERKRNAVSRGCVDSYRWRNLCGKVATTSTILHYCGPDWADPCGTEKRRKKNRWKPVHYRRQFSIESNLASVYYNHYLRVNFNQPPLQFWFVWLWFVLKSISPFNADPISIQSLELS